MGSGSSVVIEERDSPNSPPVLDITDMVEEVRAKYDLPAMGAAAVTATDGLRALGASGVRRAGGDVPVSNADKRSLLSPYVRVTSAEPRPQMAHRLQPQGADSFPGRDGCGGGRAPMGLERGRRLPGAR
jgi:hypothetical protein